MKVLYSGLGGAWSAAYVGVTPSCKKSQRCKPYK